jgi:hypothetical protein
MMSSAIGALQDLGFTIEESQALNGIIVGSRVSGVLIRAQVTVQPVNDRTGTIVRTTFQRIIPRSGATLTVGDTLDDPAIYREFFEKIAQSTFLTAHEI